MGPWLLEIQQCGCVKDIWNMSWVMVCSRVPSPLIWVKFSCSPGPVTSLSVTASRRTCDVIGRDTLLAQSCDRDALATFSDPPPQLTTFFATPPPHT